MTLLKHHNPRYRWKLKAEEMSAQYVRMITFFFNEQTILLIKTGVFISNPFACYEIATRVIYLLVCCETYILEERGSAKTTK